MGPLWPPTYRRTSCTKSSSINTNMGIIIFSILQLLQHLQTYITEFFSSAIIPSFAKLYLCASIQDSPIVFVCINMKNDTPIMDLMKTRNLLTYTTEQILRFLERKLWYLPQSHGKYSNNSIRTTKGSKRALNNPWSWKECNTGTQEKQIQWLQRLNPSENMSRFRFMHWV